MVFVDHVAEYSAALDGPGDWDGSWPVVVVGGALISGLVRAMAVVMARVLGQDPGGMAWMVDQDSVGLESFELFALAYETGDVELLNQAEAKRGEGNRYWADWVSRAAELAE